MRSLHEDIFSAEDTHAFLLQCVFPEIVQTQERRQPHASHAAHQGCFLRVKAIGEHPLMAGQMQGFIFIRIIGLLENSHIICSASVEIGIFIRIHGVHFQTDHTEVFPCDFYGLANIFHR